MTTLKIYNTLEEGIKSFIGESVTIIDESYVSGGNIIVAKCLKLNNDEKIFVKMNSIEKSGFLAAEEIGINAIAETDTIQVPKLLFRGEDKTVGKSFLAMQYLSSADRAQYFWDMFGQSLAAMHMADTSAFVSSGRYGFDTDNYIGATVQINSPRDSWIDFFIDCRLHP